MNCRTELVAQLVAKALDVLPGTRVYDDIPLVVGGATDDVPPMSFGYIKPCACQNPHWSIGYREVPVGETSENE